MKKNYFDPMMKLRPEYLRLGANTGNCLEKGGGLNL